MHTTTRTPARTRARVRRGRTLATAAALILTLAACGSGDNSDGDGGDGNGGDTGGADTAGTGGSSSGGGTPEPPATGGAGDTGGTAGSEGPGDGDDDSGSTGGAAVTDLGQTHTLHPSDGLTLAIDVTLDRILTPNTEVDGSGFGTDGDADHALLTITMTNPGNQPIPLDAVYRECVVDGQVAEYETWEGITTEWPGMVPAGGEVTWAPTCRVEDGEELTFSLTVNSSDTVWWTGPLR
ncbi:hypothetical protein [Streptomyces sp. ST2-7A]|uniref:hypothetical protein n=1 Tax=Streptomyces sp. ST2-7A TaxID=2907214 RepID=UPI001F36198C|nr:hypothetical protein [Streptomyces sp. ST2-7A]MCE7081175.1 hypothetical protein [Streptomyces sp. ST2-7A]